MSLFKKRGAGFQPALFQEEKKDVKNPGRGFYEIHTFALGKKADHGQPWDLENLCWCVKENHSLALVLLDIREARDRELSEAEIREIDAIFQAFDSLDVDLIFRPVYDREGRGLENEPMLLARIQRHMEQLSSIVMAHRQKILLIQGLMIGSWGEMHTSKFSQPQALKSLSSVWMQETDRRVAVRTPAQHRILSEGRSDSRIALYDDGIFGSKTDLGTFTDFDRDAAYLRERCVHVPNGGEVVSGMGYPGAETVLERMRLLRLSYLNSAHDRKMLDYFRTVSYQEGSLYDYIESHLGYRFVIRRAEGKVKNGELNLEVQIENTGFGSLCQEAEAVFVLEGADGERRELTASADPCLWEPGEKVLLEAKLPPPGDVTVYLALRRKWDGKILRFANQGQREEMAVLGSWGEAPVPR